jgi:hypothetical protein
MVNQKWNDCLSTLTVNINIAATGINSFVTAPVCIKYAVLATTYAELQSKTCCKKTMAKSLFFVTALDSFSTGSLRTSFRPIVAIFRMSVVLGSGWKDLYRPPKGPAAAKAASCMYPLITWWRNSQRAGWRGIV